MAPINQPIVILLVHYGDDWIRGSERCLLDLLTHLDRTVFSPIVWCNSKILAQQVTTLDIDVSYQAFPLLLGWNAPRFDMTSFEALVSQGVSLVQYYNVKLIHSNSGAPCQWLNIVARKTNLPVVAHLHCRYPLRDRLTLGLHHISHIIAVSKPVAAQYLHDGIESARISVIANGIDPQRLNEVSPLNIRHLLNLEQQDLVMLSVGSLITRKGMDVLINALAMARRANIPAKLVIVGDGPCYDELIQQIQVLNLERHVFMLGERSDVPSLLSGGIDLCISGATEEVFGLVLAEAGLHKIPVIAPDVGGISHVVKHQQTGLLVAPQAPQQMAQAIELLYFRPDLRIAFGDAATARVQRLFLIEHHVRAVESLYLTMLTSPKHTLSWTSHWSIKAPVISIFRFAVTKIRHLLIRSER